jgi:hypothetical protein
MARSGRALLPQGARRRTALATAFARPEAQFVGVERESIEGQCEECGRSELMRYPVVGESGWQIVVKCQHCLHSMSRETWGQLGPFSYLVEAKV